MTHYRLWTKKAERGNSETKAETAEAQTAETQTATEYTTLLEGMEFNLSDFALFLSVMKNKAAHESVLSIIMEEPTLELAHIHVEEVVLNRFGKRAIRLDALAEDSLSRRFVTEMQNDTQTDDIRRRSRFYQSLIDTPVLKSGKGTRYRHLPVTVVTFITQEDIFGKDLAKYTFSEQCLEIPELFLEDGTRKIFLNMSSKNGEPALVSLLQYMKKTNMDNPEILVHDRRLCVLDQVVQEVKQSEEWEAVKMSILSVGIEHGIDQGIDRGIEISKNVLKLSAQGKTPREIADILRISQKNVEKVLKP